VSDGPPDTLESRLERDEAAAPAGGSPGLVELLRDLDRSGRFHRDSGIGRVFHPGRLSLRENVATNSLHVVIQDNHVAAHVDLVSPLGLHPRGPSRYSVRRAVAHNLVGMAQDVVSVVRGRQGDHRCELDCEWLAANPAAEVGGPTTDASAWGVQLEARVAGPLDEARLRAALHTAFAQRPLDHDPLEILACRDDDDLEAAREQLHSMAVPVTTWPPVQLCLARHPAGDVLMLNLNHAAADGFGALGVLRAIAVAYAGATEGEATLDFLSSHDIPVRPASAGTSAVVRYGKSAVERLRDGLARPARLAVDQGEDRDGYGFHLVRLSAEDTRQLVDTASSGPSSGVLMTALHLAMGEWNLEHGTPGRRLHVLSPANLRRPGWEAPVANLSVTARVSTTRRERRGPVSARKAVAAQAARNKATRTGIALIGALDRSGLLPMWAKQSAVVLQPLTGNLWVDNAMLSSLGRLDQAPWFGADVGQAVELWFSTPARSPQTLCLGAATVGGRLHLSFRYPHRLFGPAAARRFAEIYLGQLRLVTAPGQ